MDIEFEWNNRKNNDNIDKHGVSFEEAREIWLRADALVTVADDRGYAEDRDISIGLLPNGKVLIVVHTYRGEKIRIISARYAKPKEVKRYNEKIHST